MNENICLNIGCWTDIGEGWLNVDASPYVKMSKIPVFGSIILSVLKAPKFPSSIVVGDVVRGLKIEPNSCKLIFASHVLEHLTREDFDKALANLFIYLQPGGTLRIIVPDLEIYAKNYLKNLSETEKSERAADEFMTASFLGNKSSRNSLHHRIQELLSNSRHQWMWDEPSLTTALKKHNFIDIKRCSYGKWSDALFQIVENPKRHYQAICVEASK